MNIQQRKALEKIVKNSVFKKSETITQKKYEEEARIIKDLDVKNRKKAEKIEAERKKLGKERERLGNEIGKLGFRTNTYNNELEVDMPDDINERLNKKYQQKKRELETLETRLVAKVWGVEKDFNSLMKEIEKELLKV